MALALLVPQPENESMNQETPDSDAHFVERVRSGEASAFELLVERYESAVRRLAYGYLRDEQLAEDVAQESFLQANEKLHTLADPGAFRSWLFMIAANRSRDELRRRARWVDTPELPEVALYPSQEEMPATRRAQSKQLGVHLSRLLAELPDKYRTALMMKEIEELTYAEIADRLGIPMGTVQIRVHRARLKLRERLSKLGIRKGVA
jgi:RNA polymerase sigma-70 factor (ECF subfamily)